MSTTHVHTRDPDLCTVVVYSSRLHDTPSAPPSGVEPAACFPKSRGISTYASEENGQWQTSEVMRTLPAHKTLWYESMSLPATDQLKHDSHSNESDNHGWG